MSEIQAATETPLLDFIGVSPYRRWHVFTGTLLWLTWTEHGCSSLRAAALEGPRRLVSPSTSSSFFGRVLDSVRSALRPRASFDCSSAGRCSPPEYCCAPEYCCSNGTCCRRSVDVPTPEAAPVPHSLVGLGADGYDASPDPFARHDYDVAAAWM